MCPCFSCDACVCRAQINVYLLTYLQYGLLRRRYSTEAEEHFSVFSSELVGCRHQCYIRTLKRCSNKMHQFLIWEGEGAGSHRLTSRMTIKRSLLLLRDFWIWTYYRPFQWSEKSSQSDVCVSVFGQQLLNKMTINTYRVSQKNNTLDSWS